MLQDVGIFTRIRQRLLDLEYGWLLPLAIIVAFIVLMVGLFALGLGPITPGFPFLVSFYSASAFLVTIGLSLTRYRKSRYGYDAVMLSAMMSALIFSAFSILYANTVLVIGSVAQANQTIDLFQHISAMVIATLLISGIPFAFRKRVQSHSFALLWISMAFVFSFLVASEIGVSVKGSYLTSLIDNAAPDTYIHLLTVLITLPAGLILVKIEKSVFPRSIEGIALFLILQGIAAIVGLFGESEYTLLWFVKGIIIGQSSIFPFWGMIIDYRESVARDILLNRSVEEAGSWLLKTMVTSKESYNILSTIGRNFDNGDVFSYSSTNGTDWILEESSAGPVSYLGGFITSFKLDMKEIENVEHISVISDEERSERSSEFRKIINGSFLVAISRLSSNNFKLQGVRETNRINWTVSEKRFLWMLSSMLATSLLQRSIIERRAETVSQMLAMVQTTRMLTRFEDDIARTYDEVAGAIVEMLGYESSSLWTVGRDDEMRPVAWRWSMRELSHFDRNAIIRIGSGVIGRAALEKKPINVDDTSRDVSYRNLFGEQTRSEYAFPVVIGGDCKAVLDVQSHKVAAFEPLDQEVINTVGRLLTLSMTLRRLYSEKEEGRNIAEARSNLIAHDLRNILQALSTHVELLGMKGMKYPAFSKEAMTNIDALKAGISNAHKFLEEVLMIAKLEAGKIGSLKDYDLMELINSSFTVIRESFQGKQFELSVMTDGNGESARIKGTEFVRDVFMNLFSNSAKYTEGSLVKLDVRISTRQDGGMRMLEVEVSDRGKGIEPGRAREVFDRFNKGASGTGLGLPLVRQIMESIGGSVAIKERVQGDYRQGTTFELRFVSAAPRQYDSLEMALADSS